LNFWRFSIYLFYHLRWFGFVHHTSSQFFTRQKEGTKPKYNRSRVNTRQSSPFSVWIIFTSFKRLLWRCSKLATSTYSFFSTTTTHTISPSKTVIYNTFITIMIHSTMKSSTREKENDRSLSSHILTLHRRLLHALNLGTRSTLSLNSLFDYSFLFSDFHNLSIFC
jgi:hypothetical protein